MCCPNREPSDAEPGHASQHEEHRDDGAGYDARRGLVARGELVAVDLLGQRGRPDREDHALLAVLHADQPIVRGGVVAAPTLGG